MLAGAGRCWQVLAGKSKELDLEKVSDNMLTTNNNSRDYKAALYWKRKKEIIKHKLQTKKN